MNEITTQQAMARAEQLGAFGPYGLTLPERMTPLDYRAVAEQIRVMGDSTGYARADLAYRIKMDFPHDYRERWAELATLLGKVPPTIANDALVGAAYSHAERERWAGEGLSYSHLRIAATIDSGRRDYLLGECVKEGWSVARLTMEIHGSPVPPRLPPPSHDVRSRYAQWLDTLADPTDRSMAEYYVDMFLKWMDSLPKPDSK